MKYLLMKQNDQEKSATWKQNQLQGGKIQR